MTDYIKLCKIIIDTNGNPSVEDVVSCGFTKDHYARLIAPNVKSEKLIKNAREVLTDRGIHYKEELK